MLKFEQVSKPSYVSNDLFKEVLLSEEPLKLMGILNLGDVATDLKGVCRVRHVGTGHVVEGHFGPAVVTTGFSQSELGTSGGNSLTVENCKLTFKHTVTVTQAKGSTKLDVSDKFPMLASAKVDNEQKLCIDGKAEVIELKKDGTPVAVTEGMAADGVITLEANTEDTDYTIEFVIAEGVATTKNNAATVVLDKGTYQIHLVARLHDDIDGTRMPNPTMLEFVKKCRTDSDISA